MLQHLMKLPKKWSYGGAPLKGYYVQISKHDIDPENDYFALYEWAKEHKVGLEPSSTSYYQGADYDSDIWTVFRVSGDFSVTEKFFGDGWTTIKGAKEKIGNRTCQSCYRVGLVIHPVNRLFGSQIYICPVCALNCEKCGERIWGGEYVKDQKLLCTTCNPIFKCRLCGYTKDKDGSERTVDLVSRDRRPYAADTLVCTPCLEKQTCGECDKVFEKRIQLKEIEGVNTCPTCHEEKVTKEFGKYEKFRIEELPKGGLTIKSLPARPIRTLSIETEVDGDKRMLCKTLYDGGLVRVPEVERYGTATPDQSKWAAFLKHDGSVTGGELISFMLDFSKKEHTEAFKTTLRKLRALEIGKFIEFNANCGGHIHIDAHGFGTENIWRLLTIWNYLEDFTYRLAGSGHSYGHRTLVPDHDRANGGRGYANPTTKGPWGVRSSVGQAVAAQDRMCGLNFQPYLGAIRFCECGARRNDRMRSCKCPLPKCTIEWRVWNSQRNPRILHAWLSYMLAVHGFADVDEEPNAVFEAQYPTLAWTKKPWGNLKTAQQDAVYERINWCFNNLVLTAEERDSLVYAIEKSDIPVSKSLHDELLAIKGPSTTAPVKRAVKLGKQNSRQEKIVIEAPKPGDIPLDLTYRQEVRRQRRNAIFR